MNIFNRFYEKFFHSRDKPQNALIGSMQYFFGQSAAGQTVNERTAMQVTAVYACVRILAENPSRACRYMCTDTKTRVKRWCRTIRCTPCSMMSRTRR